MPWKANLFLVIACILWFVMMVGVLSQCWWGWLFLVLLTAFLSIGPNWNFR